MGAEPNWRINVRDLLQRSPDNIDRIIWSAPHDVTIDRTDGQLGIKIRTYPESSADTETYTIIITVKNECRIKGSGRLSGFERIIVINGFSVTELSSDRVTELLRNPVSSEVSLSVCEPKGFTHPSDANNNIYVQAAGSPSVSSGRLLKQSSSPNIVCKNRSESPTSKRPNSDSDSMGKVKGDKGNKRLAKSNSVDSDKMASENELGRPLLGDRAQDVPDSPDEKFVLLRKYPDNKSTPYEISSRTRCLHTDASPHTLVSSVNCGCSSVADIDRTQSLPEDYPVCMNHIIVEEDDRVQSLPQSFDNGPGTGYSRLPGGNLRPRGKGGLSLVIKREQAELGSECRTCSKHPTDCCSFLLKNPHLALWDPRTIVVTLEKGTGRSFGFKFKVKIGRNPDQSTELFTLVESIIRGGPAEGKLLVGDWIRSVNGQPLSEVSEALGIRDLLEKTKTVKLVLQRPVGVSKSLNNMNSSSPRMKPAVPCPNSPMSPGTPISRTSVSSSLTEPTHLPGSPVQVNGHRQSDMMISPDSTGSDPFTSQKKSLIKNSPPVRPITSLFTTQRHERRVPSNSGLQQTSHKHTMSTGDNSSGDITQAHWNKGSDISESDNDVMHIPLTRTVNFPKVRVFVCGSEAVTFTKLLTNTAVSNGCDPQMVGYSCLELSMKIDETGALKFLPWHGELFSSLLSQMDSKRLQGSSMSLNSDVNEQESNIANSQVQDGQLSMHFGSVVNVELFVVPDDKFLHNCCHYLFTSSSVFLVTFDGTKVIGSAANEILRLQNLIHTIRCFAHYESPVLLYGFLESENAERSSVTMDEVSTLFYTSYGHQLQKYNVPMPEMFCYDSIATKHHMSNRKVQMPLWQNLMDSVQKQQLLASSMMVLNHLRCLQENNRKFISEDEFVEIVKAVVPEWRQDVQQMILTDLISSGEILSAKAAPLTLSHLSHQDKLLLIDPKFLLEEVYHLITIPPRILQSHDIKQKWLKLFAAGSVTFTDISRLLLMKNEKDAEMTVAFMEGFGLLFRLMGSEEVEYVVPYFLLEPTTKESPRPEHSDNVLYLQFKEHTSNLLFYLLCACFGSQTDHNDNLTFLGSGSCSFQREGVHFTVSHQKLEDRIKFVIRRGDKNVKQHKLFNWLSQVCKTIITREVPYTFGPQCPLEECQCGGDNSSSIHILNLSAVPPIMCGSVRVDNNKFVRCWLSHEVSVNGNEDNPARPARSRNAPTPQVLTSKSDATLRQSSLPNEGLEAVPSTLEEQWYTNELPYSVLHQLDMKLKVPTLPGRDWKGLASYIGKNGEEVSLYELQKEPAFTLLMDWGRGRKGTVAALLDILARDDMDRQDCVTVIKEAVAERRKKLQIGASRKNITSQSS